MSLHKKTPQMAEFELRQVQITRTVTDSLDLSYGEPNKVMTEIKDGDFVLFRDPCDNLSTGLYRVVGVQREENEPPEADSVVSLVNIHGSNVEAQLAELSPAPESGVPQIDTAIALGCFEIYKIKGIETPKEIKDGVSFYDVRVCTAVFSHRVDIELTLRETAEGRELESVSPLTQSLLAENGDGKPILEAIVDVLKTERHDLIMPR